MLFLAFFSASELPDDISPAADGVEDMLPLAPGLALEAPEEPASLPVPGALCDFIAGDEVLLSVLGLLCANARDDTDATVINDSARRMFFSVMCNSLNKKALLMEEVGCRARALVQQTWFGERPRIVNFSATP